jgi:hypothetical protein
VDRFSFRLAFLVGPFPCIVSRDKMLGATGQGVVFAGSLMNADMGTVNDASIKGATVTFRVR